MILEQFYLGCLAQASYLVADEEAGVAAVVDPRRDVDEYLQAAERAGVEIRHVLLTHFHADFASGHLELRERTGATIHLGAGAEADYPFTPLADGDELALGAVRVRALATPGHTPESTCYLVFDGDGERPHAVLTGDTLFIGDVGRPDLMASAGLTAEELAGRLYDSLRDKLLVLPDETIVYPGHGAGSPCGKNMSSATSSTIGEQRRLNYALQPMSKAEFVRSLVQDQPLQPAYFAHDAAFNRREHPLLDETLAAAVRPLDLDAVLDLQAKGAEVLDTRSEEAFARGHLRGSVNVGLSGKFAMWAGSVLDQARKIVLVTEPGDERQAAMRLGRIGFDSVAGFLAGGIAAVPAERLVGHGRLSVAELGARLDDGPPLRVLDVRQPGEWEAFHIAGSLHVPLGQLPARRGEVPLDGEVAVICGSGYRSSTAIGLLQRHDEGATLLNVVGGITAFRDYEASAARSRAT